MTLDLVKHRDRLAAAFPGSSYLDWFDRHYTFGSGPHAVCRRCGMEVWATIKHARNVHGDDLPDLPLNPYHVAQGRTSDHDGRLIGSLTAGLKGYRTSATP